MEIIVSKRLQSIGAYAFAEVDKEVEKLRAMGVTPIDFGVGDPTVPTPEIIRKATHRLGIGDKTGSFLLSQRRCRGQTAD